MRITKLLFVVLVAFTALSCGQSPTVARTEEPILEYVNQATQVVQVLDINGVPVQDAKVVGFAPAYWPTNRQGVAEVPLNPSGATLIRVQHPDFASAETEKIGRGVASFLIFTLKPLSR